MLLYLKICLVFEKSACMVCLVFENKCMYLYLFNQNISLLALNGRSKEHMGRLLINKEPTNTYTTFHLSYIFT